jgi:hypothetical protein
MSVCIERVKWLAAALVLLAAPGAAVTIPVTDARSTGFDASGNLLTTDAVLDENWTFYTGNSLSALSGTPVGARVVRTPKQPFSNPGWTGNDASSQWISPTASRRGNNQHLGFADSSSYIAVTSFTIPAMTNPPNWPQWWLVMSGQVWADQGVADNSFYLLDSSNNLVYTGTLSGSPTYNTSAAFQMQTWVNPNTTYRLAFILPNTSNTMAGFRLRFTEVYVTPEPAAWLTMASVGAGLVLLSLRRRRKTTQQS